MKPFLAISPLLFVYLLNGQVVEWDRGPAAPDPKVTGYDPVTMRSRVQSGLQSNPHSKQIFRVINDVPGLRVILPSDMQFPQMSDVKRLDSLTGFVLKNESGRSLVALAVGYSWNDETSDEVGIYKPSAGLVVATGGTVNTDWRQVWAPGDLNSGLDIWSGHKTPPVIGYVAMALFDDGAYYGPDLWADEFEAEHVMRRALQAELATVKDPSAFIRQEVACGQTRDCWQHHPKYSIEEWNYRRQVLIDLMTDLPTALKTNASSITHFKRIKSRKHINTPVILATPDGKVVPEGRGLTPQATVTYDVLQGSGTCFSHVFGYTFSNINNGGCVYPANGSSSNPATDAVGPIAVTGQYTAYCEATDSATGLQRRDIRTPVLRDGWTTLQDHSGGAGYGIAPRENIYDAIMPNLSPTYPYHATSVAMTILDGVVEPWQPTANLDGGLTTTIAFWFPPPVGTAFVRADYLLPYQVGITAPLGYLVSVNLLPPGDVYTWSQKYGYVLRNRTVTQSCTPKVATLSSKNLQYPFPAQPIADLFSVEIESDHYSPKGNGGVAYPITPVSTKLTTSDPIPDGYCNPLASYCCDMATHGNVSISTQLGFVAEDVSCTYGQNAAVSYEASQGLTTPDVSQFSSTSYSIGASPSMADQIGIARNTSAGVAFLLDTPGLNAYVPGVTSYSTSFAPPGNPANMIPVSGDWTGTGQSCLGFYDVSVGSWYLDANCNGMWEWGADFYYQFGGIPTDKPVVGDWGGIGKTCIGLYRSGGLWVLDLNCNGHWDGVGNGNDNQFGFGGVVGDIPVVGNWFNSGAQFGTTVQASQVGVVRCYVPAGSSSCASPNYYWIMDNAFAFDQFQSDHNIATGPGTQFSDGPAPFGFGGLAGDIFVTGDWLGTGVSQAGVYRSGSWIEDMTGSHVTPSTIYQFGGTPFDMPVVGKW